MARHLCVIFVAHVRILRRQWQVAARGATLEAAAYGVTEPLVARPQGRNAGGYNTEFYLETRFWLAEESMQE